MQFKLHYFLPLPFSYGFYREWTGEFKKPNDLFVNKIIGSTLNGVFYTVPPMCVFNYIRLINRIEIKMSGRNPNDYLSEYQEIFIKNDRII